MTQGEINSFIISKWLGDHSPSFIMIYLVCLGHPVTKAEIFAIIRKYIDHQTENAFLGTKIKK